MIRKRDKSFHMFGGPIRDHYLNSTNNLSSFSCFSAPCRPIKTKIIQTEADTLQKGPKCYIRKQQPAKPCKKKESVI